MLAETEYDWTWDAGYELTLTCRGSRLTAGIDGEPLFDLKDEGPLTCGAVGLVLTEGRIEVDAVRVAPA